MANARPAGYLWTAGTLKKAFKDFLIELDKKLRYKLAVQKSKRVAFRPTKLIMARQCFDQGKEKSLGNPALEHQSFEKYTSLGSLRKEKKSI